MSLKNVRKELFNYRGKDSWRLFDSDGELIKAFSIFSKRIINESYSTRLRYGTAVSRFIDYLYEVGIVGGKLVTKQQINDAIDYYLLLLTYGKDLDLSYISKGIKTYSEGDEQLEGQLRNVAVSLKLRPIAPASWSNTLAPINRFLRACEEEAEELASIAKLKGVINKSDNTDFIAHYQPFIKAVLGSRKLSNLEKKSMSTSSMLGSLLRVHGEELKKPRGLTHPRFIKKPYELAVLDFPMERLPDLLEKATCWRDRCLWLLTAASGIRRSEALNLEWSHIDIENETVYVLDPHFLRFGKFTATEEKYSRFKGREVSWTYLRTPYRDWFFNALLEYRKHEYVVPKDGNDFVFQYIVNPHRGKPLKFSSDASLNKSFTSAVKRAKISGPSVNPKHIWTQHSFRHAYGVYLINDFFVDGQKSPGLTEAEVQLLMGHKSVISTRKYARPKTELLKRKLLMHDSALFDFQVTENLEKTSLGFQNLPSVRGD